MSDDPRRPGAADAADLDVLVRRALDEDLGPDGDLTSLWTVAAHRRCRAVVVAKEPLVVAGTGPFRAVMGAVDPDVRVEVVADDGTAVEPGDVVLRLAGPTRSVLTGERTALNFLGRLSGVATMTRRFVDAVEGTGARVVDTRKTTPGWRVLEKAAVRAGGGTNHRMGLWDMVLVKDNHADAGSGVADAARAAVEARTRRVEAGGRSVEIEVEVRTLEELDAVLAVGVDRILLDNMSLEAMRDAVARADAHDGPRPLLEASGNVGLDTVRDVAATGVDLVSAGALTHSAPVADLSLRIEDAGS